MSPQIQPCRACDRELSHVVVDLGTSPLANSYLTAEELEKGEKFYPLKVFFCDACFLVQLPKYESPEAIFSRYSYFASYSTSWLDHARRYVDEATERFKLGKESFVVEVASNDGYLLQYFLKKRIPVLGVEPAGNVAEAALRKGVPTLVDFFGKKTAEKLVREKAKADLVIGNNVYAHVPDIRDFTAGLAALLKPNGVVSLEFPHLACLVEQNQFDTIYHEHFSYLSILSVARIFEEHGLRIFDVEELSTHGGSLRVFASLASSQVHPVTPRVEEVRRRELRMGLDTREGYERLPRSAIEAKLSLLEFLIRARREGKRVAGYGAPAKGNTLLNFCGVTRDLIAYTVDKNPVKQNTFLPGSRIPVLAPEHLLADRPQYVLILPWNLAAEIRAELPQVLGWGGHFVLPIPRIKILENPSRRRAA